MFTSAHAVVAITIAHQTGNPWIGFGLGILSHLIFDAIPHGDRNLFQAVVDGDGKFVRVKKQRLFWTIAVLEGLVAVAVCAALWLTGVESFWMVWLPALGGVLPDLLVAVQQRGWMPKKIGDWYNQFNIATHEVWFKKDLSVTRGMALQVATFVIALGLLVWT